MRVTALAGIASASLQQLSCQQAGWHRMLERVIQGRRSRSFKSGGVISRWLENVPAELLPRVTGSGFAVSLASLVVPAVPPVLRSQLADCEARVAKAQAPRHA